MHSLIVVFIPADTEDIFEAVEDLMAPFDVEAETDVDEYEEKCDCLGFPARQEAREAAEKLWGKEEDIEARIQEEQKDAYSRQKTLRELGSQRSESEIQELQRLAKKLQKLLNKALASYKKTYKETFAQSSQKKEPNPDCKQCEGSGFYSEQYNMDGFWDWWEIGGRFDKYFAIDEAQLSQKIDTEFKGCVIAVRDIPADWPLPYAALSGKIWDEQEYPSDAKEKAQFLATWEKSYRALLEKHKDDWAVACDYHS